MSTLPAGPAVRAGPKERLAVGSTRPVREPAPGPEAGAAGLGSPKVVSKVPSGFSRMIPHPAPPSATVAGPAMEAVSDRYCLPSSASTAPAAALAAAAEISAAGRGGRRWGRAEAPAVRPGGADRSKAEREAPEAARQVRSRSV